MKDVYKAKQMKKINIHDYYLSAKSILPKPLWDYIEGGASDELTIEMNTNDFKKIKVIPRRMIDIKNRSTATSILGQKIRRIWERKNRKFWTRKLDNLRRFWCR